MKRKESGYHDDVWLIRLESAEANAEVEVDFADAGPPFGDAQLEGASALKVHEIIGLGSAAVRKSGEVGEGSP